MIARISIGIILVAKAFDFCKYFYHSQPFWMKPKTSRVTHLAANNTQPHLKTLNRVKVIARISTSIILVAKAFDFCKYFYHSQPFWMKPKTSRVTHLTANNTQPYPKTLK